MNEKLVKQLLEQLQTENQTPQDIGNISIANVIIWMRKEAYEEGTIKRVIKELKHIIRNCDSNRLPHFYLFLICSVST